jgi:type I restriction enzyme R subunit
VDKNLKYHGLIQAFSRTNRILTGTKPQGNILDFRQQQAQVDEAIKLFSGKKAEQAKTIWLVEPAPVVAQQYLEAVAKLETFMQAQGLANRPEQVSNLKGDTARLGFLEHFKEVQRLNLQLDQYTDLGDELKADLEKALPPDDLRSFRAKYQEVARGLKPPGPGGKDPAVQLDFEFVLFASALIDYDYIMGLLAKAQGKPSKNKMTREQIIELLSAYSNMADEREDMVAYIRQLDFSKGLSETEIRDGYQTFKTEKHAKELATIATQHGLEPAALQAFVDEIMGRMIFDGEKLSDLLAPLDLGWKARTQKELALMADLVPFLHKLAQGRDISGLNAYE